MPRHLTLAALLAASFLAGCATAPTPPAPAAQTTPSAQPPLRVTLFALNDFHGNLKAPPGGIRIKDPANPERRINVPAGGVAAMATMLNQLRAENPNHAFVAAGDLVGATPLLSSLFRDEPTIEAFNLMGLDAAAMGNHELDRGAAEVLRLQGGGCHPADGCKGPAPFTGAKFSYLAANTIVQASGKTLFPPYAVKRFEGVPVAFIGLTLKNTPGVVSPAGVAGLRFGDEADTVNALVPELRRQGIEAIVLLIHEGGIPTGEYNECPGISGEIVDIVKRLDKAVDAVISGHTHRAYNCVIDGRPVTSALSYGLLLTRMELVLDRTTRDVVSAKAENLIVDTARYAPDAKLAAHVATYERLVQPLARRPVTTLGAPFPVRVDANGESALGQLIADAQLEATRDAGAQIALMNPGGVRAPLGGEGKLEVAYEDVFAVQPFYNQLVTLTLTGAQLQSLLERPLASRGTPRPLFVSRSLNYRWDGTRPEGQRIVPGSLAIDGRPVQPEQQVRVTANNFIADGGDDQSVLRQGRERRAGPIDVDALEAYLKARPGLAPDGRPRIVRLDAPRAAN
jgi:5'-nucleotidase